MPRTVLTGHIAEVSLQGRSAGQVTLNVFHYMLDGIAIGGTDFDGHATELVTELQTPGDLIEKYLDCCSDEFQLEQIRVQIIKPIRYSYEVFTQGPDPGNVVAEALPPNDSVSITKRNDNTTRHDRGAVRMPGVPRTFVSEGLLLTPGVTAYNALATEFKEQRTTTVLAAEIMWQPVILNRANHALSQPWSQHIVQLQSRIVRRRTVGVGI